MNRNLSPVAVMGYGATEPAREMPSGLYRHRGDDPDISHKPAVAVNATWTSDGNGGWYIRSEEWAIDAHMKGHEPDHTVVMCYPAPPSINCGGVMLRFTYVIPREYFEKWFEKVTP